MEIKRFRTDSEFHGMEKDVKGKYVKYEDMIDLVLFTMNEMNGVFSETGFEKEDVKPFILDEFAKKK